MSARYGRNQRRKHREELAARDREIARLGHVASDHFDNARQHMLARARLEQELVDWAQRIVSILGDDTAFARDMARVEVDISLFREFMDGRPMRLAPQEPVHPLSPGRPEIIDISRRVVETFAICAGYDMDSTRFQRRFMVESHGAGRGACALMMDERTMQQLRSHDDTDLKRYLLRQLVQPWMDAAKGVRR